MNLNLKFSLYELSQHIKQLEECKHEVSYVNNDSLLVGNLEFTVVNGLGEDCFLYAMGIGAESVKEYEYCLKYVKAYALIMEIDLVFSYLIQSRFSCEN